MKDISYSLYVLWFWFLVFAAIVGWFWNAIKLANVLGDPLTGLILLRIAGTLFAPLGAIVGYI